MPGATQALKEPGSKRLPRPRELGDGSESNGEKTRRAALEHMLRADDMAVWRERPFLVWRLDGGREPVNAAPEGRGSDRAVDRCALVKEWDVNDGVSHESGSPPNRGRQRRASEAKRSPLQAGLARGEWACEGRHGQSTMKRRAPVFVEDLCGAMSSETWYDMPAVRVWAAPPWISVRSSPSSTNRM